MGGPESFGGVVLPVPEVAVPVVEPDVCPLVPVALPLEPVCPLPLTPESFVVPEALPEEPELPELLPVKPVLPVGVDWLKHAAPTIRESEATEID